MGIASEAGLDLVMVGGDDNVAICKIMDYSKYQYEQHKRERHNNKNKQELKEIRLSPAIADNDMRVKAKSLERMLKDGDKVKISINYKGREATFVNNGLNKMNNFINMITCKYNIDKPVKIEGNRVYMVLAPTK
jgi:translation initiation factor IF-3